MNKGQRKAIDNILIRVNRKLDKKEKKNISKEISYIEVKGALMKAPNRKARYRAPQLCRKRKPRYEAGVGELCVLGMQNTKQHNSGKGG